jgi:hypothetical protein
MLSMLIMSLARVVSGMVSVGLKAVEFVPATQRDSTDCRRTPPFLAGLLLIGVQEGYSGARSTRWPSLLGTGSAQVSLVRPLVPGKPSDRCARCLTIERDHRPVIVGGAGQAVPPLGESRHWDHGSPGGRGSLR